MTSAGVQRVDLGGAGSKTRRGRGPASSGRRVPLASGKPAAPAQTELYVVAGRPLHIEGRLVPPGVEVPGAAHWSRLESWVSARRIAAVAPGEPYTSWAQWLKDNPAPEPAQPAQDSAEEPASA